MDILSGYKAVREGTLIRCLLEGKKQTRRKSEHRVPYSRIRDGGFHAPQPCSDYCKLQAFVSPVRHDLLSRPKPDADARHFRLSWLIK
jgi:hypothetical protein